MGDAGSPALLRRSRLVDLGDDFAEGRIAYLLEAELAAAVAHHIAQCAAASSAALFGADKELGRDWKFACPH